MRCIMQTLLKKLKRALSLPLFGVALAAVAMTGEAAFFASSADAACVTGVRSNDVLNMRSGASSSRRIVGVIPPGACGVTLLGNYRGNWGRVRYRGVRGWVNMRFIDEGGDGGSSPVRYCVSSNDGFLNFRAGPGTRYSIVGSANTGFCGMTRIRCRGKWCLMRTHEFDGWVNSNYTYRQ